MQSEKDLISANDIAKQFHLSYQSVNYYTNIGIRSYPNGKESVVLNRIVDALVFKVQNIPNLIHGGICNLGQDFEIKKLNS